MKGYVYAIINNIGGKYIGSTTNIKNRLKKHNTGGTIYTNKFKDWSLLGYLEFEDIKEARIYEKLIKKNQSKRDNFYNKIIGD